MTTSFVVAAISPDRAIHDAVAEALDGSAQVEALWTLSEYPSSQQLTRLREAPSGCIVLLDFSDPLRARAIAAELDRTYAGTGVVAILPTGGTQELLEIMQYGIREVLRLPLEALEIRRVVGRAGGKLRQQNGESDEGGSVVAFLPAKAGCGATTLAAHAASAAARCCEQRILLADLDLRLGMTSFLFKLHSEQSVLDALLYADAIDENRWNGLISRRGLLDILGSAPAAFGREIDESKVTSLIAFARTQYPVTVVDLPGDMRAYELEIMSQCREVLLVCSPDIATLHLAKKKADLLRASGLSDHVSLIVNRTAARGSMSSSDIEDILRIPVRFQVEEAEKEIQDATHRGAAIEGKSSIAKQIENIGRHIAPWDIAPARETQAGLRKFIDYFSVTPVREVAGRRN